MVHRRKFLQRIGYATGASLVGLGSHSWFARSSLAQKRSLIQGQAASKRLIVVFLRGAVDGLSLVVPYRESAYYEARPTLAIAPPGSADGAIDLDGQFGLHPKMQRLLPLWKQKQLVIVQNCGLPELTRSHFGAQDAMELGTPGNLRTPDGWMNRLLAVLSSSAVSKSLAVSPIQAINVGHAPPRILVGPEAIATLAPGKVAERRRALDQEKISQAFDRLYEQNDILSQTYQEARDARKALQAALQAEATAAGRGAPLPQGFARDAQRLARIMRQDSRVQLAFFDLGGWDTHVNQGGSQGQLSRKLGQLGEGLGALKSGLGRQFEDVAIVVMSEFGRTVKENGNGGTDHGRGNSMLVLGGQVPGGKIYGDWQGLEPKLLNENRDLPVTTDFRDVLAQVLSSHLQLNEAQIAQVFPAYKPTALGWS